MYLKKKLVLISVIITVVVLIIGAGVFLYNKKQKSVPNRVTFPKYLFQISAGEAWGKLLTPQFVLPYKGKILVSDTGNGRILAFDSHGKYLFQFEQAGVSDKRRRPYPYGLAADDKGNIYVADTETGKILIYNDHGKFIRFYNVDSRFIAKPTGIYIRNNKIYISDVKLQQVHVFDQKGKLLLTIGSGKIGNSEKDLSFPNMVIADGEGNIYITDNMNNRIQVFKKQGQFMKTLGVGKGLDLMNPRGIAMDSRGNIYVANTLNKSIKVLNKDGGFLYDLTAGANYTFNVPAAISIDRQDNIYIADRTVLVFGK